MAKGKISSKFEALAQSKNMRDKINVYVDNSNIYIGGQGYTKHHTSNPDDHAAFRIYFENFTKLAIRNRIVRSFTWGGSTPPQADGVWKLLRDYNIEPDLIPRSSTGENETVDNIIQLRMHRHTREHASDPGTIVLCTGDGKGYHNQEGFLYDIKLFVDEGWSIELITWPHCCHKKLMEFCTKHGTVISLAEHYESISFIQGGRNAMTLSISEVEDKLL